MASVAPVRLRLLQVLMALDAVVLMALGVLFMTAPSFLGMSLRIRGIPTLEGVSHDNYFSMIRSMPELDYMIGLWGCALISLGIGYLFSIRHPARNVNWARAGIVRGALECMFGFVAMQHHFVRWDQAALGTVVAGAFAAAYLILYPAEGVS